MPVQIKLRRDTQAAWTTANPILALGEPGLEIDTDKIKYGDGGTAWNSLPYFQTVAQAGTITGQTLAPTVINSSLTSVGTLINLTVTNPISGSITGNANTATSAITSSNIAGGLAGNIPFQAGSGLTSFIPVPNTGSTYLQWTGTTFNWVAGTAIAANASSLVGATLNSTVLNSSLTSVGTLAALSVNGSTTLTGNAAVTGTLTVGGTDIKALAVAMAAALS